jgi:hypothetical protein
MSETRKAYTTCTSVPPTIKRKEKREPSDVR